MEGHTGGSRSLPTVHPCSQSGRRLWVARKALHLHEPNHEGNGRSIYNTIQKKGIRMVACVCTRARGSLGVWAWRFVGAYVRASFFLGGWKICLSFFQKDISFDFYKVFVLSFFDFLVF